jgi:hypothetical protein
VAGAACASLPVVRRGSVGAITACLLGGLASLAAPAAAGANVGCAALQSALNKAKAGEVITLDELCVSGFPYKLPKVSFTLAGTPGAGFSGGKTAQVEGGGAPARIESLIFTNAENSEADAGAGLSINTAGEPFGYTLADDTFTNDKATATLGGGGGARLNTSSGAVTVTGSTFTGDSSAEGGGLFITANTANISGDTFEGDSTLENGSGGGLAADLLSAGSALSDSTFKTDTATDEGGGADLSLDGSGGVSITITANTFSHDSVADPSGTSTSLLGYSGGGLALGGFGAEPTTAVQSDNIFDSDSVSFKAAPAMAAGGGEGVDGAILQSTRDRFANSTLQSPSATENKAKEHVFGWGAGASIIACADSEALAPSGPNLRSTVSDAVVAGNTLLSGPSANGAGIYVGSFACHNSYAELALSDSTVSGNVVSGSAGPVAGISGGPHDVLTLANTIVFGDGGPELGGFGTSLANVSASFSDVCSGSAPFAGAGNICADPKLVGPGPGSADVHETAASPTLEAGSNALVPSGLTTDAFGSPRIIGPIGCGSSPPAVVDIGAAELAYPAPPCVQAIDRLLGLPVVGGLSQSAKVWREGRLLAHASASANEAKTKRLPIGTIFRFSLNEPARVTFTFTRQAPGRRVAKKCVAQTNRNKHKHLCTRTIVVGALSFSGHAGANKLRFQGRVSTHKRLKSGRSYSVLVTATVAGKRSATRTLHFRIAG